MTDLILNPENHLSDFLKGPANELDAIGDYSSEAAIWAWKHDDAAQADAVAAIVRLSVILVFREKTDVIAYGGLLSELPSGISMQIRRANGATIPWLGGNKIRSHVDIGLHAGSATALQIDADTTNKNSEGFVMGRVGTPEGIRGVGLLAGDGLELILNDDFSETGCKLVMHRFTANGFYCKVGDLVSVPGFGYKL